MEVRELTPADRPMLESFSCAGFTNEPSYRVQEMIRERLADQLAPDGHVTAVGFFDGADLCGLAAWSPVPNDSEAWMCHVVAVATGCMRRGLGTQIKRAVIERAGQAGVLVVISFVEEDNEPMLQLNARVGATVDRDPEGPRFFACRIEVPTLEIHPPF